MISHMATDPYSGGRLFSSYVGAEVRGEAGRQKVSIAALARGMSMDRSTLIRYLDGVRAFPLEALYMAAEVLDQDPGHIVAEAYNRFLLDEPDIGQRCLPENVDAETNALCTPHDGIPLDVTALRSGYNTDEGMA